MEGRDALCMPTVGLEAAVKAADEYAVDSSFWYGLVAPTTKVGFAGAGRRFADGLPGHVRLQKRLADQRLIRKRIKQEIRVKVKGFVEDF